MFIVEELPAHIYGITHFEENIQDEWFIVSLLFEITKQIPDIIVRVVDVDGEFILIEAADYLPNWANPETCEQRVGISLISFVNRSYYNSYIDTLSVFIIMLIIFLFIRLLFCKRRVSIEANILLKIELHVIANQIVSYAFTSPKYKH